MRIAVLTCAFLAACGGGGGAGPGSVAATVDGQRWTVTGQGSVLTPVQGMTAFTIVAYTPIPGSTKKADLSKPALEIVFSDGVPAAGSYDIAATPALSIMYWADQNRVFGATEGTLVIAHISATAADGSFSFTATLAPSGPDTVTVTDGSFSVPIGP
jgi:hypothetical protein